MTFTSRERFDVAAIRRAHPIETVVAASGVELTRRGHGFMGCCPFHDDSTASLSVGGVPDRFHCFGCDAGGDVIEYVARFTGLSFVDAVRTLESGAALGGVLTTTAERAHAINHLAWEFFTTPANISESPSWLASSSSSTAFSTLLYPSCRFYCLRLADASGPADPARPSGHRAGLACRGLTRSHRTAARALIVRCA
jgi:CHC2 zinc finger